MRRIIFILLIFPYSLFASSVFNPPWCSDNYPWKDKKDIYTINSKLISKDILDKTGYFNQYALVSEKFYSRAYSDTIIEYTNYKGEEKHIIIEGLRVAELYEFLFTALNKNKQLFEYLTCSKQFDDLNEADYKITEVTMMLPPNGKGLITRYGTEYSKSHNLALLMSYYMKSASSLINSESLNDFEQVLIQYMVENPFRASQIAFQIKNAKNTYDILSIVYDEVIRVLNIIKENPKYKKFKYITAITEQVNKNYKDVIKNKNNNIYQSSADILTTNIKDIFNYIAKEGLNATIKWLGLEGVLKSEEAVINMIVATGMLREMKQEENKKPIEFFVYYFKDVPYKKKYDYLTTAVYYLLKNNDIPFPDKNKNYSFYPNQYIQKGDVIKILINEFLYDEYMIYNSNARIKTTEMSYLYNEVMKIQIGGQEKVWDNVTPALMKLYLKNIFEFKTAKIAKEKYSKLSSDKQKLLEKTLERLAKKSYGVAKINDADNKSYLTKGEVARIVFSTQSYDWNEIVKTVYEAIILPEFKSMFKYKRYEFPEERFLSKEMNTLRPPQYYIQKGK